MASAPANTSVPVAALRERACTRRRSRRVGSIGYALIVAILVAGCAPAIVAETDAYEPSQPPPVYVERLSRHLRAEAYVGGVPATVRTVIGGWRVRTDSVELVIGFDVDELAFVRAADLRAHAAATGGDVDAWVLVSEAIGAGARPTYLDLRVRNRGRSPLTVDFGRSSIAVPERCAGWLVVAAEPLLTAPVRTTLRAGQTHEALVTSLCRIQRGPGDRMVAAPLFEPDGRLLMSAGFEMWLHLHLVVDRRDEPLSVRLFAPTRVPLVR